MTEDYDDDEYTNTQQNVNSLQRSAASERFLKLPWSARLAAVQRSTLRQQFNASRTTEICKLPVKAIT